MVIEGIALRARRKRFELFRSLLDKVEKPVNILDVGGEQEYWEDVGFEISKDIRITILNIRSIDVTLPNFDSIVGDARMMVQFHDSEYGVVFSNGVIQLVGEYDDQRRMADEVRRVGKRYFIQAPNKEFPIHYKFLIPYFQCLPLDAKTWLMTHFKIGRYKKLEDREKAKIVLRRDILPSRHELKTFFPEASLLEEKVFGFVKSYIACYGWDHDLMHSCKS